MPENEIKEAKETVDDLLSKDSKFYPVSESGHIIPEQLYIATPEDYWRKKQPILWTGLIISSVYFLAMILLYL